MPSFLTASKNFVNKMLSPFDLEVIKIKDKHNDLLLYPETKRPIIPHYINIGAGSFYHPYWHNLDMVNEYYANSQKHNLHIEYDITSSQPLPFNNSSIKVAYTSHVIEHICDEDVMHLFREVYRSLEPGGVFRITCPDMDLEFEAFSREDDSFWRWPNAYGVFNTSLEQSFLDHFATAFTITHPEKSVKKYTDQEVRNIFSSMSKEDAFNLIVNQIPKSLQKSYPGDHVNWFNTSKIMCMLKEFSFNQIYESRYRQSQCPMLRNIHLFDTTCPELSLYVECRK